MRQLRHVSARRGGQPVQLIGDEERNKLSSALSLRAGSAAHVDLAVSRRADSQEDLEQPISRSSAEDWQRVEEEYASEYQPSERPSTISAGPGIIDFA